MKNSIFTNSIIYTISGLLLKCFSFFLLPLYTAYLTTEDYGIINISNSFISTISFVVAFSLFAAASRFYVEYKDDPEKLKRFYGSIISFVFISSNIFGFIFFLLRNYLSEHMFGGIDFYPVILVCLISLVFNCQHTLYDSILRGQQRGLKCSILAIATFFVTLVLNITFVVVLKWGAVGTLLASLIAYLIYTVYFVIDMIKSDEIRFCLNWSILKPALKYSIPIIPHNLSAYLATLISQILIGNTHSIAAVGIYGVASQFGNMADTVQSYVNSAYGPWLFEKLHDKNDDYKKVIRDNVGLLCKIISLFFIGLSFFSQDFIQLFLNKGYFDSWKYITPIVLVYSIKTVYYFYVSVLFYYQKASKLLFTATLTGSVVNILLSSVIIPIWGIYGSVLADAIAMLIRTTIVVFISKQFEDTGLRIGDFIFNIVATCVIICSGMAFSYISNADDYNIYNLLYKVVLFIASIIFMGFPYRKTIYSLLMGYIKKLRLMKEK